MQREQSLEDAAFINREEMLETLMYQLKSRLMLVERTLEEINREAESQRERISILAGLANDLHGDRAEEEMLCKARLDAASAEVDELAWEVDRAMDEISARIEALDKMERAAQAARKHSPTAKSPADKLIPQSRAQHEPPSATLAKMRAGDLKPTRTAISKLNQAPANDRQRTTNVTKAR